MRSRLSSSEVNCRGSTSPFRLISGHRSRRYVRESRDQPKVAADRHWSLPERCIGINSVALSGDASQGLAGACLALHGDASIFCFPKEDTVQTHSLGCHGTPCMATPASLYPFTASRSSGQTHGDRHTRQSTREAPGIGIRSESTQQCGSDVNSLASDKAELPGTEDVVLGGRTTIQQRMMPSDDEKTSQRRVWISRGVLSTVNLQVTMSRVREPEQFLFTNQSQGNSARCASFPTLSVKPTLPYRRTSGTPPRSRAVVLPVTKRLQIAHAAAP